MAKNQVTLTFAGDSKSLEKAFDRVGAGAKDMAGDLDKAAGQAKSFGSRIDAAGSAAGGTEQKFMGTADVLDGLATTMGFNVERQIELARGFGDLAGGIDNLKGTVSDGAEKIGKLAGKIRENGVETVKTTISTVRASAVSAAHTVKTIAQTVATNAQTIAQKALNLAMRANPILLVVTALAALAAGLIVAYKKSETFREIVHGALDAVQGAGEALARGFEAALGAVRGAFEGLGRFLEDYGLYLLGPIGAIVKHWDAIAGGARTAKEAVVTAFGNALEWLGELPGKIGRALTGPFEGIKTGASTAKTWITERFEDVVTFLAELPARVGRVLSGVKDKLIKPFTEAWERIKWVVDQIRTLGGLIGDDRGGSTTTIRDAVRASASRHAGGIVPGPPGAPRTIMALGGERVLSPGQSSAAPAVFNVYALDARSAADGVAKALREYVRRNGPIPGIAT